METVAVVALVVSIIALLLTGVSFWWTNLRKGNLYVSEPRSYAALGSKEGILVQFPFIFFNDGPTPIIIENLHLVFTALDEKPLTFIATVEKLGDRLDLNKGREFATQFAVLGHEAKQLICEFQCYQGFPFASSKYPIKLEAQVDEKKEWVKLRDFTLNVHENDMNTINSHLRPHDNMSEF